MITMWKRMNDRQEAGPAQIGQRRPRRAAVPASLRGRLPHSPFVVFATFCLNSSPSRLLPDLIPRQPLKAQSTGVGNPVFEPFGNHGPARGKRDSGDHASSFRNIEGGGLLDFRQLAE